MVYSALSHNEPVCQNERISQRNENAQQRTVSLCEAARSQGQKSSSHVDEKDEQNSVYNNTHARED